MAKLDKDGTWSDNLKLCFVVTGNVIPHQPDISLKLVEGDGTLDSEDRSKCWSNSGGQAASLEI